MYSQQLADSLRKQRRRRDSNTRRQQGETRRRWSLAGVDEQPPSIIASRADAHSPTSGHEKHTGSRVAFEQPKSTSIKSPSLPTSSSTSSLSWNKWKNDPQASKQALYSMLHESHISLDQDAEKNRLYHGDVRFPEISKEAEGRETVGKTSRCRRPAEAATMKGLGEHTRYFAEFATRHSDFTWSRLSESSGMGKPAQRGDASRLLTLYEDFVRQYDMLKHQLDRGYKYTSIRLGNSAMDQNVVSAMSEAQKIVDEHAGNFGGAPTMRSKLVMEVMKILLRQKWTDIVQGELGSQLSSSCNEHGRLVSLLRETYASITQDSVSTMVNTLMEYSTTEESSSKHFRETSKRTPSTPRDIMSSRQSTARSGFSSSARESEKRHENTGDHSKNVDSEEQTEHVFKQGLLDLYETEYDVDVFQLKYENQQLKAALNRQNSKLEEMFRLEREIQTVREQLNMCYEDINTLRADRNSFSRRLSATKALLSQTLEERTNEERNVTPGTRNKQKELLERENTSETESSIFDNAASIAAGAVPENSDTGLESEDIHRSISVEQRQHEERAHSESVLNGFHCVYFRSLLPGLRNQPKPPVKRSAPWIRWCIRSVLLSMMREYFIRSRQGSFQWRMPEYVFSWFMPIEVNRTGVRALVNSKMRQPLTGNIGDTVKSEMDEKNISVPTEKLREVNDNCWAFYYGLKELASRDKLDGKVDDENSQDTLKKVQGVKEAKLMLDWLDERHGIDELTFSLYCIYIIRCCSLKARQWGPTEDENIHEEIPSSVVDLPPSDQGVSGVGATGLDEPPLDAEVNNIVPPVVWVTQAEAIDATGIVFKDATQELRSSTITRVKEESVNVEGWPKGNYDGSEFHRGENTVALLLSASTHPVSVPEEKATVQSNTADHMHIDLFSWIRIMLDEYHTEQAHRKATIRVMFDVALLQSKHLRNKDSKPTLKSARRQRARGEHPSVTFKQVATMLSMIDPSVKPLDCAKLYRDAFSLGGGVVTFESFLAALEMHNFFSRMISWSPFATSQPEASLLPAKYRTDLAYLVHQQFCAFKQDLAPWIENAPYDVRDSVRKQIFTAQSEIESSLEPVHIGTTSSSSGVVPAPNGTKALSAYRGLLQLLLWIRDINIQRSGRLLALFPLSSVKDELTSLENIFRREPFSLSAVDQASVRDILKKTKLVDDPDNPSELGLAAVVKSTHFSFQVLQKCRASYNALLIQAKFKQKCLNYCSGSPLGYKQLSGNGNATLRKDYSFYERLKRDGLFSGRHYLHSDTLLGLVNLFLLHFSRYRDKLGESNTSTKLQAAVFSLFNAAFGVQPLVEAEATFFFDSLRRSFEESPRLRLFSIMNGIVCDLQEYLREDEDDETKNMREYQRIRQCVFFPSEKATSLRPQESNQGASSKSFIDATVPQQLSTVYDLVGLNARECPWQVHVYRIQRELYSTEAVDFLISVLLLICCSRSGAVSKVELTCLYPATDSNANTVSTKHLLELIKPFVDALHLAPYKDGPRIAQKLEAHITSSGNDINIDDAVWYIMWTWAKDSWLRSRSWCHTLMGFVDGIPNKQLSQVLRQMTEFLTDQSTDYKRQLSRGNDSTALTRLKKEVINHNFGDIVPVASPSLLAFVGRRMTRSAADQDDHTIFLERLYPDHTASAEEDNLSNSIPSNVMDVAVLVTTCTSRCRVDDVGYSSDIQQELDGLLSTLGISGDGVEKDDRSELSKDMVHFLGELGVRSTVLGTSRSTSVVRLSFPSLHELVSKAHRMGFLSLHPSIFDCVWMSKRNRKIEGIPRSLRFPKQILDSMSLFLPTESEGMLNWLQRALPPYSSAMQSTKQFCSLEKTRPIEKDLLQSFDGSLNQLEKLVGANPKAHEFSTQEQILQTVATAFYHWYCVFALGGMAKKSS